MGDIDSMLAATIRAYTRDILTMRGFVTADMTDEQVQRIALEYARAPYRCGECGQMVQGEEE